jgi:hypothetical protein
VKGSRSAGQFQLPVPVSLQESRGRAKSAADSGTVGEGVCMQSHEIENWTLRVIECAKGGQPFEELRVEIKADWPNSEKAARRIAAHANAAHGEPILWIIGVDQEGAVVGARHEEMANWWPSVQKRFNELPPSLLADINVPAGTLTVVALVFETDRAPYVVKMTDDYLEVPWRDGTRTRSAKRGELLRILSPLQRKPNVEVLGGSIYAGRSEPPRSDVLRLFLAIKIYVVPCDKNELVIPFSKCEASIGGQGIQRQSLCEIRIAPPPGESLSVGTRSEAIVHSAGELILTAKTAVRYNSDEIGREITLHCRFRPVNLEQSVPFTARFVLADHHVAPPPELAHQDTGKVVARWDFAQSAIALEE